MATSRYTIPKMMVINPVQIFPPTLADKDTIPDIMRNNPAINTNTAATKLNKLGLKINPIPKIIAKTPKVNSTTPIPLLSSNVVKPAAIGPTPKNSTARPVNTPNGITPKTGKAIIIKRSTIKPKHFQFSYPLFNTSTFCTLYKKFEMYYYFIILKNL